MDQLSFLGGPSPIASTSRKARKPPKLSRDAKNCLRCGVPLTPRPASRGMPRKWCLRCAEIARRGGEPKGLTTKPCQGCGVEITGRANKKWCQSCAAIARRGKPFESKGPVTKFCDGCGVEITGRSNKRWCDERCAAKHRPRRSRAKPCRLQVVYWKPKPLRRWIAGYCAECDEPFVTNVHHARFCSKPCASKWKRREKGHRRRKRKKAQHDDRISLMKVAKRDDWLCHLCRLPVDKATWSIDHLVPLSHGGSHTYDNVALAHRLCNSIRADRPLKETQAAIAAVHARLEQQAA